MMGRSGIAAPGGSDLDLPAINEELDAAVLHGSIGERTEFTPLPVV
jgi:hypothetical protein